MIQFRQRAGFTCEPQRKLDIVPEFLRKDLDCDNAIESFLTSLVDGAHSTGADQFNDLK